MNTAVIAPEADKAVALAEESFEIAKAYTIDSPDMYQAAGEELRSIATRKKQIEELRLSLTRPLDESKKRIMDLFRAPTERLEQAEQLLRNGMLTWKRAEDERVARERAAAEAAARAERERIERERREAEEAARKAREEAAALAAAGNTEAAIEAELAAEEAALQAEAAAAEAELAEVAPIALPVVEAPKAAGISSRHTWKFEVTDKLALIKAAAADPQLAVYLVVDEKALGGVVRALKAETRIPGVRVYAEESLAVRRA